MTHFGEGEWADFVRGMPIENESRMVAHLAVCADCHELVAALRAVEDVHRRDLVQAAPSHAVQEARAIFARCTADARRS